MSGKRIVFTGGTGKRPADTPFRISSPMATRSHGSEAAPPGASHFDRRPDGQRAGFPTRDHPLHLRRLQAGRRARPTRWCISPPSARRQPDNVTLHHERHQHLQRHRGSDEARRAQGHHRLERDHLWRLLRGRRQGFPLVPARRGLRCRSDGFLRPVRKVCEKTPAPSPCAYTADIYALRIGNGDRAA